MVVYDLDIESVTGFPAEANTPLLVDANAVLSDPVSGEGLKAICRWDAKVIEVLCAIEHSQLVEGALLNVTRQAPGSLLIPYFLSFCIA